LHVGSHLFDDILSRVMDEVEISNEAAEF